MGGDRSFTGWFMYMLRILQSFKEWKEKKKNKEWKEKYGENKEVENIEKNDFLWFLIFLKQSEKQRKLTATNY